MYPSPKNLLTDYMERPERQAPGAGGWFDLDDWVGPQRPSGRGDVAKIEGILANCGDYSLERTQGPTGYWGLALDDGIRKYQKRNGLKVDGALRPGGPTIRHMQGEYADLLDGHAPPTPEDIDRHHDIVSNDNPGIIAWQPPPVSFDGIEGLPEIDQATDASNVRYVRAMLKSKGFGSFPQLFAKTIEDSGASGLAAVRDLVAKYDAARPGEGGQLASAVTGLVSEKAQKQLGIEVPKAQPPGTVQVAGKFDTPAKALLNLFRRVPPMLTPQPDGAGNSGSQRPSPPLIPQPDRPGNLPGGAAQPESPSNTGHPAPEPVKPSVLPNIPPLSDSERKPFVDKFLDAFIVEYRYGDGKDDKRGKDSTILLNNTVARACQKAISESKFPELIKHLGGASEEGKEGKYKSEKRIDVDNGKVRLPDYTMGTTDAKGNIKHAAHINTVTTRADGSPTLREQRPLDDMIRGNVKKFVDWIGKIGDSDDPDDSFDAAYKKCVKGVKFIEGEIIKEIEEKKQESGE